MSAEEMELDELLGAYALDAVSDEERRAVEQYLLVNPRARQEVQEHREAATMLAWTGMAAPEGLWDRIAASLDETPAPAPSGELAAVLSLGDARAERSDDRSATDRAAARRRRRRRSALGGFGAWAAASAAAAVVAVVAVTALDDDGDEPPLEAAVAAARGDRDSVVTTLVGADGAVGGEAIIDQDGHGYLVLSDLPALPDDRTYQLWGVIDGAAISLGVLGPNPEIELFTVDGPVTQIVITNEVAGGVISDGNPDGAYAGALA